MTTTDVKLADLIVNNAFARVDPKKIPPIETISDALFSSSSSARGLLPEILEQLIAKMPADTEESQIESGILRTKCSNIVSFPSNLANFVASTGEKQDAHFDHELYDEKLADTIWRGLIFTAADGEPAQQLLANALIQASVHRGLGLVLLKRFTILCAGQEIDCCARASQSRLQRATASILEASTNRKAFIRKGGGPAVLRLTSSWSAWMNTLLTVGEKSARQRPGVVTFFAAHLLPAELPETIQQQIQKYVLDDAISKIPTSRAILRFIFIELFTATDKAAQNTHEQLLLQTLEAALASVFVAWKSKDLVANGRPEQNESCFNAAMYSMLYLKERKVNTLPVKILSPFLDGVTARLQCVHVLRQIYGMTSAAGFAAFFVESAEVSGNFLQNPNFGGHLEKWLAEEASQAVTCSRDSNRAAAAHGASQASRATFVRTETVPLGDGAAPRPLDPDAPYYFFTPRTSVPVTKIDVAVALRGYSTGDADPDALPSFGVQKLEQDDTDVAILRTFRESYDSLMGIGRGANAQMHEVQQAIEAGLCGMAKSLQAMKTRLSDRKGNVRFPPQFDPLVSALLPVLMSLSIYAPEDRTKVLYGMRYSIFVDIITLSTKISLHVASSMIYGSNYGVYQRVEIVRAIGDAARALSGMELTHDGEAGTRPSSVSGREKRIYPPIPASSSGKRAIVLEEGKLTRRWGNAVQSRMDAKSKTRRYLNVLGDAAPHFVSCLLARLDADHFKFNQETDPYVPAEVLRALVIVFQGVSKIRHVAPVLCEQNIEFFFTVATRHPHAAVKKQAWVATGEVMRCWCGAPPAMEPSTDNFKRARGFSYTGSLMFTENWLNTLEVIQAHCVELDRKKDPIFVVAALTISALRDLVFEQKDVADMSSWSNEVVPL